MNKIIKIDEITISRKNGGMYFLLSFESNGIKFTRTVIGQEDAFDIAKSVIVNGSMVDEGEVDSR